MSNLVKGSFFLAFLFLRNTIAFAESQDSNFYSYVIHCPKEVNRVKEIELLDFFEANLLINQVPKNEIITSQDKSRILQILFQELDQLGTIRSKQYQVDFQRFWDHLIIRDNQRIVPPIEFDNLLSKPHCQILPLAAMIQTEQFGEVIDNKIMIDGQLWGKLALYEQVAVVMDFVMMKEIRGSSLIPARTFMGYWFSGLLTTFNYFTWIDFVKTIGLPYFESQGLKIDHTKPYEFSIDREREIKKASLYQDNLVTVQNQTLILHNRIELDELGNLSKVFTKNDLEISLGQDKIKVEGRQYALPLKFFSHSSHDVEYAQIKKNAVIKYGNHEFNLDDNYSEIAFWQNHAVRRVTVQKAKLKIGENHYQVGYDLSFSSVFFYESGEVECSESFLPKQKFVTESGKKIQYDHYSGKMCFTKSGLVKEFRYGIPAPSSAYLFDNNGYWNLY
jgi:hypothetical protein